MVAGEKGLIRFEDVYEYALTGAHCGSLEDEEFDAIVNAIESVPKVDAVPVDEICVAIFEISIENQEAVLNVSICGKANEVKVPFSKEVAEVAHGQWIAVPSSDMMTAKAYKCSECGKMRYGSFMPNYCQNCGTKMDGGADNGI